MTISHVGSTGKLYVSTKSLKVEISNSKLDASLLFKSTSSTACMGSIWSKKSL